MIDGRKPKYEVINGFKICTGCGKNLPISAYPRKSKAKTGLTPSCRECISEKGRSYRRLHPEYQKQYDQKRKSYRSAKRIQDLYGLTSEEFKKILIWQGEQCAICWTKHPGDKNWNVDHDHKTGKVRGLLCRKCNLMLGFAKDSANLLSRGIQYLQKKEIVNPDWIVS